MTERDVCGIVVTHEVADDGRQDQMLDRISLRGPDGAGSHRGGEAWLGHRRLAIVDIDGGTRPLIDDRDHVLVGNGRSTTTRCGPSSDPSGSGAAGVLRAAISARLEGAPDGGDRHDGLHPPRSAEEALYQRIFVRHLGGVRADKVLGLSAHGLRALGAIRGGGRSRP